MEEFTIGGQQGHIRIVFVEVLGFPDKTSYYGGYDVKGKLDIRSGNYYVKDAEVWFTTGQLFQLYVRLREIYSLLTGSVSFANAESDFQFDLEINRLGQIAIQGRFQEIPSEENILHFEFQSEQSYLDSTLKALKSIVGLYGDLKGIRKQN